MLIDWAITFRRRLAAECATPTAARVQAKPRDGCGPSPDGRGREVPRRGRPTGPEGALHRREVARAEEGMG